MSVKGELLTMQCRINSLEKKLMSLENKWKFELLDKVAFIDKDRSYEGYDDTHSFTIIDKKEHFYRDFGISYLHSEYVILVDKKNKITIPKQLAEEQLKKR